MSRDVTYLKLTGTVLRNTIHQVGQNNCTSITYEEPFFTICRKGEEASTPYANVVEVWWADAENKSRKPKSGGRKAAGRGSPATSGAA